MGKFYVPLIPAGVSVADRVRYVNDKDYQNITSSSYYITFSLPQPPVRSDGKKLYVDYGILVLSDADDDNKVTEIKILRISEENDWSDIDIMKEMDTSLSIPGRFVIQNFDQEAVGDYKQVIAVVYFSVTTAYRISTTGIVLQCEYK